MAREARALACLNASYPLAPRLLEYCEDSDVLGAPFQLVEYRPGISVGAEPPPEWSSDTQTPNILVDALVEAMVGLHELYPGDVGLSNLGKPGFVPRQVEGWSRRAFAAYDGQPPCEVEAIVASLRQRLPAEPEVPSLLHCDLKLDNMLFDAATRTPVAVVDWDMTTTGDRYFDLGVLLAYWVEAGDPPEVHDLRQVPSLAPGFPDRENLARRYLDVAKSGGVDLPFYVALGRLRLAIAWRQLFVLYRKGTLTDDRYADFDRLASVVLTWTATTLHDQTL